MSKIGTTNGKRDPPLLSGNHFVVRRKDTDLFACMTVEGVGVEQDPVIYKPGGKNKPIILSNEVSYPDVTLKRGFTENDHFVDWIQKSVKGPEAEQYDVELIARNKQGESVKGFVLTGACPIEWHLRGAMNTMKTGLAVEDLTLTHTGIEKMTISEK